MIEVSSLPIEGLKIIQPRIFHDARGYFFESFSQKEFNEKVERTEFVQDNQSKSTKGVFRGMHFQKPPHAQAKLVRCVEGEVLDIALDIRKGSPTYGRFCTVLLSAEQNNQFFIPRGFAHGFVVISETAVFQYKCDAYYAPQSEGGVSVNDPMLLKEVSPYCADLLLSDKDKLHPLLSEFDSPFVYGENC